MIRDGSHCIVGFRDGRVVFGRERVENLTMFPDFRNAPQSCAALHDARLAEMQAKGHS
jgi:hypothetical protein